MSTIQKLPVELANQIAAGEVVENPASVVKELVENSIDAGASAVTIELFSGGLSSISVRDNGCGLSKDDLALACEQHATSKISSLQDLEAITSMGFRGEALASIASVSRFRMTSKTADSEYAWQLQCEASSTLDTELVVYNKPIQIGTLVEVRDLFFRVPARQKFLASSKQEYNKVRSLCKKLILAHPSVDITLLSEGKKVFEAKSAFDIESHTERIKICLGAQFIADHVFIEEKVVWGKISGWCAKPLFARRTQDLQYFILNKRPIIDKSLSFAMRRAYQDMLPPGCYPAFCLYLEMDPVLVDVNVHPSKDKVRFSQLDAVTSLLKSVVSSKLRLTTHAPSLPVHSIIQTEAPSFSDSGIDSSPASAVTVDPLIGSSSLSMQSSLSSTNSRSDDHDMSHVSQTSSLVIPNDCVASTSTLTEDVTSLDQSINNKVAKTNIIKVSEQPALSLNSSRDHTVVQQNTQSQITSERSSSLHLGFALAQLHGIYILSQSRHGLIIIDMHAAHERILYEKLKTSYKNQGVVSQALLMPLLCDLPEDTVDYIRDHALLLEQMGFSTQILDQTSINITGYPSLLEKKDLPILFQDIMHALVSFRDAGELDIALHKVFSSMACHSAIRANRPLSKDEMHTLLRQIEATEGSSYCNHGRPVWFLWTIETLDKIFRRGT